MEADIDFGEACSHAEKSSQDPPFGRMRGNETRQLQSSHIPRHRREALATRIPFWENYLERARLRQIFVEEPTGILFELGFTES
jgi:hypothetical protein